MALWTTTRRKLAVTAVAGIALVGGGGAAAWAATTSGPAPAAVNASSTSGSKSTGASRPAHPNHPAHPAHPNGKARRVRGLLARADRATLEIKQKGHWVTFSYDRGKVSGASPTSVSLALPDGHTVTIALTPTTHYQGISGANQLKTGKPAVVVSEAGKALRVRQAGGAHVAMTPAGT